MKLIKLSTGIFFPILFFVCMQIPGLYAQSLNVTQFNITGDGSAQGSHVCDPAPLGCDLVEYNTIPFSGGVTLWGENYDWYAAMSFAEPCVSDCGTTNVNISAFLSLQGHESNEMLIKWNQWASVYNLTETDYGAYAENTMNWNIDVSIDPGTVANPGDPVTVYYQYNIFAAGWTTHENNDEDPMATTNSFSIEGASQLGNACNFNHPDDLKRGIKRIVFSGELYMLYGDTINLSCASDHSVEIDYPGESYMGAMLDRNTCTFTGSLELSLDPIDPLPVDNPDDYIDFSLDIGSDTELSDPHLGGNEYFDPGDAYRMANVLYSAPVDGHVDDENFFGTDPVPDPDYPGNVVPCGSGSFTPELYFNLDALDVMQASLTDSWGDGLDYFDDEFIHFARHFLVSYDDDWAENWSDNVAGNIPVPVESGSTFNNRRYGTTHGADEVVALDLQSFVIPAFFFTSDSLWSEEQVHATLAPNPDIHDSLNNDVNALNYMVRDDAIPFYYYFSVDNEAHFQFGLADLLPGTIYKVASSGVIEEVVRCTDHLGLSESTDIDAFTFAWVWDNTFLPPGYRLALIFSVDADDWTTSGDESGGLNPAMLYYSYMNGTHYELLNEPMSENVDALTCTPFSYHAWDYDDPLTGNNNAELGAGFTMYPNPAGEILHVNTMKPAIIRIFNMQGQLLLTHEMSGKSDQIDLSGIKAGMYLIEIGRGESKTTAKLFIHRNK